MDLKDNKVLDNVIKMFEEQQAKGLSKYGELVNVDSYTFVGWIEHFQQELIDALVYTECMKQKLLSK